MSHEQHIKENWQVVKTCLKYRYKIEDFKIWEDYIDLLRWFKKDLNNSAFVCPENLNQAHDKLVVKKRELQRKKYLLKIQAEIEQAQVLYTQEKKQFFGLCFSEKDITISVLEDVTEFMEEGDSLKHCVFTNEYFKKKDSLVFSARIDSKPIETIEVCLSKMVITQCRGSKNNKSQHHKIILDLMNKNLYQINSRMKKKKVEKY